MGPRGTFVIHANGLSHQQRVAAAFQEGFKRHGIDALVTSNADLPGDLHVVVGPHFALSQWRYHPRSIWIDRALWGDPECVTVGWCDGDRRRFPEVPGRPHPPLQPEREGRNCLVLADYGDDGRSMALLAKPHMDRVDIRRHPAEGAQGTIQDALAGYQVAIGRSTTALVDALIAGLHVVCLDCNSIVYEGASHSIRDMSRPDRLAWIQRAAGANWSLSEITRGETWHHLSNTPCS